MGVYAVILAGGTGERLGGVDKASLRIGDRTLLECIVEQLSPQCCALAVSSRPDTKLNHVRDTYVTLPDPFEPQIGPLGGIYSGALWVQENQQPKEDAYLLVAPVDTPAFPKDFVEQAIELMATYDVVLGQFGEDIYPVSGLWRLSTALAIGQFVQNTQQYAIRRFLRDFKVGHLDYAQNTQANPFKNINEISDLLHFSAG